MDIRSKFSHAKKKDIYALSNQFIRFGFVGLSNTAISLGIYYVFIFIDQDLYLIGNTVGFIVSVLNAYFWSNKFVFKKSEEGHIKPILKTYISYGLTFLIGTGLLYILVQHLHIQETVAPLLILFITIPLNFLLNKFWSFK